MLPDRSVLIGQKLVENAKIQMRHFGWFSNTVVRYESWQTFLIRKSSDQAIFPRLKKLDVANLQSHSFCSHLQSILLLSQKLFFIFLRLKLHLSAKWCSLHIPFDAVCICLLRNTSLETILAKNLKIDCVWKSLKKVS